MKISNTIPVHHLCLAKNSPFSAYKMNWTVTIHENDEVAARLDEGVRDGIGKRIPGEKRPCWMSNRLFIGLKYGGRGKGGLGEGFSFRPVK